MKVTKDELQEILDSKYLEGNRAVWSELLGLAIRNLGAKDRTLEQMILERESAISALRSACMDHGDNEWPENLHLADIINKHLVYYLMKIKPSPEAGNKKGDFRNMNDDYID